MQRCPGTRPVDDVCWARVDGGQVKERVSCRPQINLAACGEWAEGGDPKPARRLQYGVWGEMG